MKGARLLLWTFLVNYEGGWATYRNCLKTKFFLSVFSAISVVVGSRPPAGHGVHGCEISQCLGEEEARAAARTDLESLIEQSNSQHTDRPRCVQGHVGRAMDLHEG